jgi:hypothetical protein
MRELEEYKREIEEGDEEEEVLYRKEDSPTGE